MAHVPPVEGGEALPTALLSPPERPPRRRLRLSRAKLLWAVLALALSLAAYTLVGSVLAPRWLRSYAIALVRERYARTLSLGEVRIDPFALRLEVESLSLPDRDGVPLVGFDRLAVHFHAARSLWERALVFREIMLVGPHVRAVVRPDGALNLGDLVPRATDATPHTREVSTLPSLWVEDLTVRDGQLAFRDLGRKEPFSQHLAPVSFSLRRFRTTREGGAFSLSALSDEGARLAWKGSLALAPAPCSTGTLEVAGLPLSVIADYLGEALPFAVTQGVADLTGDYDVSAAAGGHAALTLSRVAVRDLDLRARGVAEARVRVPSLAIDDARLMLEQRTLAIGRVTLGRPSTRALRERDGSLDLARLFAPPRGAAVTPEAPPWSLTLSRLAIEQGELALEDDTVAPRTRVELSALDLTLSDLSLDTRRQVPLELSARVEPAGRLQVSGKLRPSPLAADLDVQLERAPLARIEPYLRPHLNVRVREGTLGAVGKLALDAQRGAESTLRFTGEATLDQLALVDGVAEQELLRIPKLSLSRLRYQSEPASISVAELAVEAPALQLSLDKHGMLNLAALAPTGGASRAGQAEDARTAPGASLAIETLSIARMQLRFVDHLVKPSFAADLHDLSGTLRGLSSESGARASLSLSGRLGHASPVSIAGTLSPFAYDKATDIRVRLDNVALPVFSPYALRLAGYHIVKGELSTTLRYQLRERRIEAGHTIRIDQLTWGEPSPTRAAAPLPVKLATALLKDRHGVIKLELPVRGRLDDPQFGVGPVLWKSIENVAAKAVVAPFAWLGSLFDGAERARFVEFAPGSAELDPRAKEQLAALGKALDERPALSVDVPFGTVRALDGAAVVEHKLQQAILDTMRALSRGRTQGLSLSALEVDAQIDVLEALHERLWGDVPDPPDAPEPPPGSSWRARRALKKAFVREFLEQRARARIRVTPEELDALGQQRAEAIERALLTHAAIDPTRVLLSKEQPVTGVEERIRFELALR